MPLRLLDNVIKELKCISRKAMPLPAYATNGLSHYSSCEDCGGCSSGGCEGGCAGSCEGACADACSGGCSDGCAGFGFG